MLPKCCIQKSVSQIVRQVRVKCENILRRKKSVYISTHLISELNEQKIKQQRHQDKPLSV